MTTQDAKDIIKGRTPDCSKQEVLSAWQYLINSGDVWGMGPWYSRMASCQIEAGTLERNAAE